MRDGCAVVPRGVATGAEVREMMLAQGDDPRALFFSWCCEGRPSDSVMQRDGPLMRAAEMGYAPAQVALGDMLRGEGMDDEGRGWLEKAVAQGFRRGLSLLGQVLRSTFGGTAVRDCRLELLKSAAELGDVEAMFWHGVNRFSQLQWERYHWVGKAMLRLPEKFHFNDEVVVFHDFLEHRGMTVAFEDEDVKRSLFQIGVMKKQLLDALLCHPPRLDPDGPGKVREVLALYDAARGRARAAVDCWSIAGRRLGLVKDMRVMIAKKLWEEAWQWAFWSGAVAGNEAARKRR
jgi:hypothetical protein